MTAIPAPIPADMAPAPRLLTDRLDFFAHATPDADAILFGERRWSYAEWRDDIRAVAAALQDAGIGPGDHVAVLDKNHPHTLLLTFAAGLLGAATAVVNFRLSPDELAYVIEDSHARLLFVGEEFTDALAGIAPTLTRLRRTVALAGPDGGFPSDFLSQAHRDHPYVPDAQLDPDTPCLILYTSGTTGYPKGAMLTHRGICAHTVAGSTVFQFSPGDVNLVAMPLFHVGGSCYAMYGLHAGVPTIMTREPDGPSLLGAIAAGASHAFLVPAVVAAIVQAGERAMAAFGRLRYLGYGASPMPLPVLRTVLAAWPATRFIQVYGMTELSGVVTTLNPDAHRDHDHAARLASAGVPLPGVQMRVVDPVTDEDVPVGERGELWFRTDQRMAGYWDNPAATASTITLDGWVRSGDLAELDDGGFVFIVDRVKDMIISGGENIYSSEVERVLGEHPSVMEVAVIGIPDDTWGESVHAIVAPYPGSSVDAADVIAFCRDRLAHYKCPRTVDVLEALPRNGTGKILKRSLRAPFWEGRARAI